MTAADTNFSTSVSPYIPGAWPYLLRALNWAKSNSIHVILDIHGAPGSQNGYDNSGQRTPNPQWAQNPANVSLTIDMLKFISEQIGGLVDVIELLNEPAGYSSSSFAQTVRQFWLDGYDTVRATAGGGIKIMIGDAFLGVQVCSIVR
jgi:glucan 1,3-beta-glucosidase